MLSLVVMVTVPMLVPVLELVPVRVMVRVRRAVALGVVRRCEVPSPLPPHTVPDPREPSGVVQAWAVQYPL